MFQYPASLAAIRYICDAPGKLTQLRVLLLEITECNVILAPWSNADGNERSMFRVDLYPRQQPTTMSDFISKIGHFLEA